MQKAIYHSDIDSMPPAVDSVELCVSDEVYNVTLDATSIADQAQKKPLGSKRSVIATSLLEESSRPSDGSFTLKAIF